MYDQCADSEIIYSESQSDESIISDRVSFRNVGERAKNWIVAVLSSQHCRLRMIYVDEKQISFESRSYATIRPARQTHDQTFSQPTK